MLKKILRWLIINFSFLVIFKSRKFAVISFAPAAYYRPSHPSHNELKCMIAVLRAAGFSIIVVDHRRMHYRFMSVIKPKIFIGLSGFHQKKRLTSTNCKILYSTGAAPEYVWKEISRIKCEFPDKQITEDNFRTSKDIDYSNLTHIVLIGSEWTKSTYRKYTPIEIKCVEPHIEPMPLKLKGFSPASIEIAKIRKLLWVGSKGIIHKGYWQALQFAEIFDVELTCIGIPSDEMPLAKRLARKFEDLEINLFGFLRHGTLETEKLVTEQDALFFYSLSEGTSTALINFGNYGLPIIANDRSGVHEITPVFSGFTFSDFRVQAKAINGQTVRNYDFRDRHSNKSLAMFQKALENIIYQ